MEERPLCRAQPQWRAGKGSYWEAPVPGTVDPHNRPVSIHHPITYVSGLFKGPQLNWAALTKEAYAIYMVARKLDYYLREAETTIRSDHLPLKSFLLKNTKNDKVNNWGLN